MPPLVIEFIGLPGAGKTTIAQNVIEELTVAGYRCFGLSTVSNPESIEKKSGGFFGKLQTLYHFLRSCVMYRRLAIHALLYTWQVNPFNLVGLRRFFILIVRLNYIKTVMNENYDLLVLDQGPIQNVWSIATTGRQPKSDKYLQQLLKSILDEVSPLVIKVEIETDLAHARITKRPTMRSRFDRMSPSMAEALLSRHGMVFAELVDLIDRFKGTSHLNVHGDQPVQTNTNLIVPFIKQAWHTHSL